MNQIESKEMYLETILVLKKRGSRVRAVDVANSLGFSRPSVSNAVKKLYNDGLIYVGEDGELTLTDKGMKSAADTYERHLVLTDLLVLCGANETIAEDNACRIEHVISEELFDILKGYLAKVKGDEKK